MIFPNILGGYGGLNLGFQYRVPMDDTHTWHVWYTTYFMPGADVPKQDVVPYYEVPLTDENGRYMTELIDGGDLMAWSTQGPIAKRELERLGESDKGIIMFRNLIEEQIRIVEEGGEPMNVHRKDEGPISLPQEYSYYPGYDVTGGPFGDQPNPEPDLVARLSDEAGISL